MDTKIFSVIDQAIKRAVFNAVDESELNQRDTSSVLTGTTWE